MSESVEGKRILYILATPFFIEKGSSIRARSMIEGVCSNCKEVDLLTYPLGENIEIENLNILRPIIPFYNKKSPGPSFSKIYADLILLFYGIIMIYKKDYDLIHGGDVEGGSISLILSKIFQIPFIYSIHNLFKLTLEPYDPPKIFLEIANIIDRVLIKNSKRVIVNWEYQKKDLNIKNALHIPNAFSNDVEKVEIPVSGFFTYSGNFMPYQGVDLLLKSFSKVRNKIPLKLVLVGKPTKEVKSLIKDLSLDDSVYLTNQKLSIPETNYILKSSKFCVIPRKIDGAPGMKIYHYLANNKPVLATNLTCNTKILEEGKNAYFVNSEINDISKGIKEISKNVKHMKKLDWFTKKSDKGSQELVNSRLSRIYNVFGD